MTKERLFGMCLDYKVKVSNKIIYTNFGVVSKDFKQVFIGKNKPYRWTNIGVCQLIARRISSITNTEQKAFFRTGKTVSEFLDENELTWESFEWLIEHGFLLDKYFDNGWVVEEVK